MTEPILEQLMEHVLLQALEQARIHDLPHPLLGLVDPDGHVILLGLAVPEIHPSEQARVILLASQATHAVVCFESWEVSLRAPQAARSAWDATGSTDAMLQAIREGDLPRPSQHPERFETLTLIGQIQGQPIVRRSWLITRGEVGAARVFIERDLGDYVDVPSRFNPLFGTSEEVRTLVRRYAELARLRDQTRARRS